MISGDIERISQDIYGRAGLSSDEPAPPTALVKSVLGTDAIRLVPRHALPGDGAVARVGDTWRIYLVAQAAEPVRRFVMLHELAHVVLGKSATEEDCNGLAAALLAPKRAFLRALEAAGARLPALARTFGTTQSCVGLRLGEVTEQPTALVAPESVRFRGAAYGWPSAPRLQELAAGKQFPGIRKARLSDRRERTVLRAV
jgi:hypothetical protein